MISVNGWFTQLSDYWNRRKEKLNFSYENTFLNVFVFCANNPATLKDYNGEFVISTISICVITGSILFGAIGGFIGYENANSNGYTGYKKTKSILYGICAGGIVGGILGYIAAPALTTLTKIEGVSVSYNGISTIATVGTSFGKLGTLITNNGQQVIDWGITTAHGLQRMLERGITQEMVETWVNTGKALQQSCDKIMYVTKEGVVVINKIGAVITAYTNQNFDLAMKQLIEKLFGK